MALPEAELIERKLVSQLQRDFPLDEHPYQALARSLGVTERDVLSLISGLKEKGLVRQIGPVIDARRLGYQSTLVASEVPAHELRRAEAALAGHPGISHAYGRDHTLNVWFTLSFNAGADVEFEVANLGNRMGATQAFSLPALRLFKIGAFFGVNGDEPAGHLGRGMPQKVSLSGEEKKVINAIQRDLPLISSPFVGMAQEAEMPTPDFLSTSRSLIDHGVIRRYGAAVNHRRAGYEGNGMACWDVPSDQVESVGERLASVESVSHCYERQRNPSWRHNVFAMFHGGTREVCAGLIRNAAEELRMPDYLVLFSTREIRKVRVRYLA